MSRVLVLQHVACEHLGLLEPLLKQRGLDVHYVRAFAGDPVPRDLDGCSAVIALGGPMSANDGERPGFIADELRLLEQGLAAHIPLLGICLGSQMIAKAAGASVRAGPEQEIGWYPLSLTDDGLRDPLFAGAPATFPVFQWHGETFDIPQGAVCLAASERYPHQAFRLGANVYGFQFHMETTTGMIHDWLDVYREQHVMCGETVQHPRTVLSATLQYSLAAEHRAHDVFGRYVLLIRNEV